VSQAADRLGVHAQRVHQRIADGSLPAVRVGHQWAIDEADLARLDRRASGRPLSEKSAWVMAAVAAAMAVVGSSAKDGDVPVVLDNEAAAALPLSIAASDRSRARARLRSLLSKALESVGNEDEESAAADVAAELRALLRNRAARRLFRCSPRDLDDLRSDRRIRLSGISLRDSGIASADIVEGYVADQDLDNLINEFLLSDARHLDANVVLHVVNPGAVFEWSVEPDNWLLLAADLAEHHRPREVARAVQLVHAVAEHSPVLPAKRSR
jgi:excisionase family DNA binding protein